jgi:hypothetical protein
MPAGKKGLSFLSDLLERPLQLQNSTPALPEVMVKGILASILQCPWDCWLDFVHRTDGEVPGPTDGREGCEVKNHCRITFRVKGHAFDRRVGARAPPDLRFPPAYLPALRTGVSNSEDLCIE